MQGMSWRKIAKALKIGTATALRLFNSPEAHISTNTGAHVREPIELELGHGRTAHE
jgi:hypothetical protein